MKPNTLIIGLVCLFVATLTILTMLQPGSQPAVPDGAVVSAPVPAPAGAPETRTIAGEVSAVTLGRPDDPAAVRLIRGAAGWRIDSLYGAPADADKVGRFVRHALDAARDRKPLAAAAPAEPVRTGVSRPDEGVAVVLSDADGRELLSLTFGLNPAGRYDAVYARLKGDAAASVLPADLRGEAGLWKNDPDAAPASQAWLAARVLTLDAGALFGVEMTHPDHVLSFSRDAMTGNWRLDGGGPDGALSLEGLTEWLASLADLRVVGAGDPGAWAEMGLDNPTHRLRFIMSDGAEKSVVAARNAAGDFWVATSDHPGQPFLLPRWRFRLYFECAGKLFPDAVPSFNRDAIRAIDIRNGSESVKFVHRGDSWRAVAIPYPVREDIIDKLGGLLSDWRPDDYADGEKTPRFRFGEPLVEVSLSNGEVYQYRLGGKHPLFARRYVTVNGVSVFSVSNAVAQAMFPELGDVLVLGPVFPALAPGDVLGFEYSASDAGRVVTLARDAAGVWTAATDRGAVAADAAEVESLLTELLSWKIAGYLNMDAERFPASPGTIAIKLTTRSGVRALSINPMPGEERLPALSENERVILVDRTAYDALSAAMTRMFFEAVLLTPPSPETSPEKTPEAVGGAETPPDAPATERTLAPESEKAAPDTPVTQAAPEAPGGAKGEPESPAERAESPVSIIPEPPVVAEPAVEDGPAVAPVEESPAPTESADKAVVDAAAERVDIAVQPPAAETGDGAPTNAADTEAKPQVQEPVSAPEETVEPAPVLEEKAVVEEKAAGPDVSQPEEASPSEAAIEEEGAADASIAAGKERDESVPAGPSDENPPVEAAPEPPTPPDAPEVPPAVPDEFGGTGDVIAAPDAERLPEPTEVKEAEEPAVEEKIAEESADTAEEEPIVASSDAEQPELRESAEPQQANP